jgi:hypothetical protein
MAEEDSEKTRTANGYIPEGREILTEGYQPQGSDDIPTVVPRLVSGVCPPTVKTPTAAEKQSAARENVSSN